MGKRRKPTRKPNYQSLDDIKLDGMRMASDEMRYLTEEMPTRELGPAYERLLDITDKMNQRDQMFIDAGVPASEFRGFQQLQVPQLKNGVPAPYIDTVTKPGLERRVHTQVVQNPKTGGNEITPISNPETKKALVTEFGDGRDGSIDDLNIPRNPNKVGDRASELLGKHIMWLKGDKDARIVVGENDYARPDLDVNGQGIDVHTLRTGVHNNVVEIQVNTGVNPRIAPRGNQEIAVKQMIVDRMKNGENMFEAIESLKNMERGGLEPIRAPEWAPDAGADRSPGKLVKEGYDGLVAPLFDWKEARENVATKAGRGGRPLQKNQQDKQVLKPHKIFEVDLHELRDTIDKMSPLEQSKVMNITPNQGNGGDGMHRSRINVNMPANSPGIVDISEQGYVAQLLRNLKYA
jgi:hypothetical protein